MSLRDFISPVTKFSSARRHFLYNSHNQGFKPIWEPIKADNTGILAHLNTLLNPFLIDRKSKEKARK